MLALAAVALAVGACAGATPSSSGTPPPPIIVSLPPDGTVGPGGSAAVPSIGPGSSISPVPLPSSACLAIGLGHVDPVLEAPLPCTIGGIDLERFSTTLATYISSATGGDRDLYAPWLVGFGLTPDNVNIAIVVDLTDQENFLIHAIGVPKVDDAQLVTTFADQAQKARWTVATKTIASKQVLELTQPSSGSGTRPAIGYLYAKNHVLYTIITDSTSLLLEALIKLP